MNILQGDIVKSSGYKGKDKHEWYGELVVQAVWSVIGQGRMCRCLNPRTGRSTPFRAGELELVRRP